MASVFLCCTRIAAAQNCAVKGSRSRGRGGPDPAPLTAQRGGDGTASTEMVNEKASTGAKGGRKVSAVRTSGKREPPVGEAPWGTYD